MALMFGGVACSRGRAVKLLRCAGLAVAGFGALVACFLTAPLHAQEQRARSGAIAGVITDTTGRPLQHANVHLEEGGIVVATNDSGHFHMAGVPAGEQLFTVRRIGYRVISFHATLAPDTTIVVAIRLRPVQTLEEIEVIAAQPSARFIATGYEARRRLGLGTFLTPERIDSIAPYLMHVSQLFRDVRGVEIRGGVVVPRREPKCMWLFIDGSYKGTRAAVDELAYSPGHIHAIEVYERPSLVPAEFQGPLPSKSGQLTVAGGCGAIAVWTKSRR